MTPLFSIITVTYNAEHLIGKTIESVKEQNFYDYEYIVMDGASKDNTLEVVKSYDIKNINIVSKPDHGIYDAMNDAMDVAKGEYLIFLNAGDVFSDSNSLHIIADTAKRTHADIVYGQTKLINASGEVVGMRHLTAPSILKFKSFKHGMLVCHQAFVARRKIAPKYDMQYKYSADYEWCLRILKQSKRNAYCGTTIIGFLIGGTTTANHKASLKERFVIMSRYYGLCSAIFMHLSFIPRFLFRK